MRNPLILICCMPLMSLGGCERTAQDTQAEGLRTAADKEATQLTAEFQSEATALGQQSRQFHTQAKQAGGYTGERLEVQADALDREGEILLKQGRAKAAAVREAADAQAKHIAAR